MKIVFYFYQVVDILLVTDSHENIFESNVVDPVMGIFHFQVRFSFKGFICPFPGLTAITKQLLLASHPIGVTILIGACYLFHCIFHKYRRFKLPSIAPYLGALLECLLLGFFLLTSASFKMIRCTSVKISGEYRLFIDGNEPCFQWWQYLTMVFIAAMVIPFIVIIALGSHWLYKGSISAKEFLLSCIFPLPYLIYKAILFRCGNRKPCKEPPEWKKTVSRVLYGPFRKPQENSSGSLYWESVLVSRRLLLILIQFFVNDLLLQYVLLSLGCFVILLHHSIVRPFQRRAANIAEGVSLFILIVLALVNTYKASLLSNSQELKGPLKSIDVVLEMIQTTILIALPACFILGALVAVLSLIIRLIYKSITFIKSKCWTYQNNRAGYINVQGIIDCD